MSLELRGIHVSAYAPPDSYRYRLRRQRRDRMRRVLLSESARFWALCLLAAAITTIVCWQVGA